MAIAAVYILLVTAISLLALAFWKEDYWLAILSGFIFVATGLRTVIYGIEDISDPTYRWIFGILILFIGVYIGSRAAIESFKEGL